MDTNICLPEYVTRAVHEIAENNGFRKCHLLVKNAAKMGDGFCAQILGVTISELDDENVRNRHPINVIVKIPPTQKDYRRMAMLMFKREVYMYNNVLPVLKEFQSKIIADQTKSFTQFPVCYFAQFDEEKDEAVLILEDLRDNEYRMENKYEVIGLEQARLVIQTIAKFHATSIALKHTQPELFEPMRALDDLFKPIFTNEMLIAMTANNIERTSQTLTKDGDDFYKEKLKWFNDHIVDVVESIWNAEPLSVPIHGDCWTNNFMFKYEVNIHSMFFSFSSDAILISSITIIFTAIC